MRALALIIGALSALVGCTTAPTTLAKFSALPSTQSPPFPSDTDPPQHFAGSALPANPTVQITWQYNHLLFAPIVFEVWHSTAILPAVNWSELVETNGHAIRVSATNDMELFKVRARDPNTGLVSDWATVQ